MERKFPPFSSQRKKWTTSSSGGNLQFRNRFSRKLMFHFIWPQAIRGYCCVIVYASCHVSLSVRTTSSSGGNLQFRNRFSRKLMFHFIWPQAIRGYCCVIVYASCHVSLSVRTKVKKYKKRNNITPRVVSLGCLWFDFQPKFPEFFAKWQNG